MGKKPLVKKVIADASGVIANASGASAAETLTLSNVRVQEHELPEGEMQALEVLRTFKEGATLKEWVEKSGKARTTLARHRDALMQRGLVSERDGKYYAAEKRDKFKELCQVVL